MFRILIKRRHRRVFIALGSFIIFGVLTYFASVQYGKMGTNRMVESDRQNVEMDHEVPTDEKLPNLKQKLLLKKQDTGIPSVSKRVHGFYYAWYGNPTFDGKYFHWNHKILPHWTIEVNRKFAVEKRHEPPDDIGANYFPLVGAYSSKDPFVLQQHMEQLIQAGIGVLSLSWYPPGKADDEGKPLDSFIFKILDSAHSNGIQVCFHLEPYAGRNALSVAEDIKFIQNQYGNHPAFYKTRDPRDPGNPQERPLIYVYDSYLTPDKEWREVLTDSKNSIRGTPYDAIVIGLLVELRHKESILNAGFDGFYTYFASSGFSYGSNRRHWSKLSTFAQANNLIFIPSVGPGYIDTNIRPWNGRNTKNRDSGAYYEASWRHALQDTTPPFVSITSFNEWGEGTQIEPAASDRFAHVQYLLGKPEAGTYQYESYGKDPYFYLKLTRKWIDHYVTMGNV